MLCVKCGVGSVERDVWRGLERYVMCGVWDLEYVRSNTGKCLVQAL